MTRTKVVFCLPGKTFSNYFLDSWTKLLSACKYFNVVPEVKMAYNPNVYKVRNLCLMANSKFEGEQKPFGGTDYDYIMWIDSDSVFAPSHFEILLNRMESEKNLHILSGIYLGLNGEYMAGKTIKNNKQSLQSKPLEAKEVENKAELIKVDFSGMGFMLVRRGVFESLDYPWFYPMVVGNQEKVLGFITEDVGFCIRAAQKGFATYVDPKVTIGHEKPIILK